MNLPDLDLHGLLRLALPWISRASGAKRVSSFRLNVKESRLSLDLAYDQGQFQRTEEMIYLPQKSPFWALLTGKKAALSYKKPYPLLYVPLRWAGLSPREEALGVLRLEKPGGKKPFASGERNLAVLMAEELAQNLYQVDLDHKDKEQVRRLSALAELAAIFASSLRVEAGIRQILQGIQKHFRFDRVRLYLVDKSRQTLRGELSVDVRGKVKSLRQEEFPLRVGEHRFSNVLLGSGEGEVMEKYKDILLHLPLIVQGQPTGLLVVDNLLSQQSIQWKDVGVLKSFPAQIALAVDNARLFDEVQELSLYDTLTKLPLRRYFFQRAQEELYRAERFGQPLSLLLLDMDFFKQINDTYGHQVGDEALKAFSQTIVGVLRKIDFPCRYGGDEILVLLPQARREEAQMIATRLLSAIRSIRISVPFARIKEIPVSVSMGAAVYPEDGKTIEELIEKADAALYWIKSHGRDSAAFYQEIMAGVEEQPGLFQGDVA